MKGSGRIQTNTNSQPDVLDSKNLRIKVCPYIASLSLLVWRLIIEPKSSYTVPMFGYIAASVIGRLRSWEELHCPPIRAGAIRSFV